MSTSVLKALPGKLDIKRHSPSILYIPASLAMSTSILKALPGKLDIKRRKPGILNLSEGECNFDRIASGHVLGHTLITGIVMSFKMRQFRKYALYGYSSLSFRQCRFLKVFSSETCLLLTSVAFMSK